MIIPDTLTPEQEEVLITLRALAGLVAQALRRKVSLDIASDAYAVAQANAGVYFWRNVLLHHTRRLLPIVIGGDSAPEYRQFAESLVRTIYLEDQEAIADHGCDPLTCTHPAHGAANPHKEGGPARRRERTWS